MTPPAPALPARLRPHVDRALVALLALFAFALGFVAEYSGDFHWHLVLGDWTLAHHAIYRHDTLSHTFLGAPMQVSAWLGDVALALAFRGGYPGVYVLRGAVLAIAAVALARLVRRFGVPTFGAVALVALWLAEGSLRFFLRPEMFGLACFALVLERLFAATEEDRLRAAWPALPVITAWANLHGSVNLGLLATGLVMGELALRRAVARRPRDAAAALAFIGAAAAAACASPEGLGTILVYRMLTAGCNAQVEWGPMTLTRLSVTAACLGLGAVVASAAALVASPRRARLAPIALAAALAVLTAKHMRFENVALLASVVAIGAAAATLGERLRAFGRPDLRALVGATLTALVLAGAAATAAEANLASELSLDVAPGVYPTAACDFVRASPPPGKMLNGFNIGGYLAFCLGGATPVAIDQRVCSVYPGPFYTDYVDRLASRPTALADDLGASFAFVEHGAAARAMSRERARWRLVWLDDEALVYVRADRPETASFASEVEPLAPWTLDEVAVPESAGALDAARRAVERQEARCPSCDVTALARVALAAGEGDARRVAAGLVEISARAERDGRLARLPERARLVALFEARAAGAFGDAARMRASLLRYLALGGREDVAALAGALAFGAGR